MFPSEIYKVQIHTYLSCFGGLWNLSTGDEEVLSYTFKMKQPWYYMLLTPRNSIFYNLQTHHNLVFTVSTCNLKHGKLQFSLHIANIKQPISNRILVLPTSNFFPKVPQPCSWPFQKVRLCLFPHIGCINSCLGNFPSPKVSVSVLYICPISLVTFSCLRKSRKKIFLLTFFFSL